MVASHVYLLFFTNCLCLGNCQTLLVCILVLRSSVPPKSSWAVPLAVSLPLKTVAYQHAFTLVRPMAPLQAPIASVSVSSPCCWCWSVSGSLASQQHPHPPFVFLISSSVFTLVSLRPATNARILAILHCFMRITPFIPQVGTLHYCHLGSPSTQSWVSFMTHRLPLTSLPAWSSKRPPWVISSSDPSTCECRLGLLCSVSAWRWSL